MIEQIIISWFLTQATMSSVLGDWFFVSKTVDIDNNCTIYKGDAHNLFGNICYANVTEIIDIAKTIQVFILANLALSVILFFTLISKPNMKIFKMLTSFLIFIFSTISTILWHTTHKEIDDEEINYFGVGWYFQVAAVVFSGVFSVVVFANTNAEI